YVTARQGAVLEVAELRQALVERLPAYMVPSALVVLAALPLTANGKLDRKALPAAGRAEGGPDEAVTFDDLLEVELLSIWEEVLGRGIRDLEADFFELGGHSLLAIRLLSAVRDRTGIELRAADVFLAPTVRAMARLLRRQAPAATGPLVKIRGGAGRPNRL